MKFSISLFVFLISFSLSAATWYVDNAATGLRNGTSWANAWTNLSNVNSLSAGDTVFISGGTTSKVYQLWDGSFHEWVPVSDGNGTAGNPITYSIGQDEGHNGTAIFDGTGLPNPFGRVKTEGWRHGVITGNYNGENHIIVTNCAALLGDFSMDVKIDHVGWGCGLRFLSATNMELSYLYVKPRALVSVAIQSDFYKKFDEPDSHTNNVVRNCTIVLPICSNTPSWGSDGLSGGRSMWVKSNWFTTYFVTNNSEWQHNDGWQNLGGSDCRIEANTFENFGSYPIYWECLSSVTSIRNVEVINNVFRYTNGYILSNSSAVATTIGPQGASGQTYSNIVVANNTVVDHWRFSSIVLGQTTTTNTWTNSIFANNLFINSRCGSILNRTNGSSFDTVTNGIFYGYNKGIPKTMGVNTFSPAQLVSPGGDENLVVNSYVQFSPDNNMHPVPGDSAVTGFGLDMSPTYTIDADGILWNSSWGIGAFKTVIIQNIPRTYQLRGIRLTP